MKRAIKKVIGKIEANTIFDVHFVSEYLLQHYSDEYYRVIRENPTWNQATFISQIGTTLANELRDKCVEVEKSTSFNIHGNVEAVRAFKKVKRRARA